MRIQPMQQNYTQQNYSQKGHAKQASFGTFYDPSLKAIELLRKTADNDSLAIEAAEKLQLLIKKLALDPIKDGLRLKPSSDPRKTIYGVLTYVNETGLEVDEEPLIMHIQNFTNENWVTEFLLKRREKEAARKLENKPPLDTLNDSTLGQMLNILGIK